MSSGLLTKKEIFSLPGAGVSAEFINLKSVTLQSSKFLCVRDKQGGEPNLLVASFNGDDATTNRYRVAADGALMNPTNNIIAVKDDSNNQVQILQLEPRMKLKGYDSPSPIVFWAWASPTVLALVTATEVLHWHIDGDKPPARHFERLPEMATALLLAYKVDVALQYALLVGVKKEESGLVAVTQFFSAAGAKTRVITEHAGGFAAAVPPGQTGAPRTLMCLANVSAAGGAVSVVEVPDGTRPPVLTRQAGSFPAGAGGDFPVAVVPASDAGLLYVVMRNGMVYLFSLFDLRPMDAQQVTAAGEPVFMAVPHEHGFMGVTTRGSVVHVSVNFTSAAGFAQRNLGNADFALRLASAGNVEGSGELFKAKFQQQLQAGDYLNAMYTARSAPNNSLRTKQVIDHLGTLPCPDPANAPQKLYYKVMLEAPPLNPVESVAFAGIALARGKVGADKVLEMYRKGDLTASVELGDALKEHDPDAALEMYRKVGAKDRLMGALLAKGDVDSVLESYIKPGEQTNWLALVSQRVNAQDAGGAQALATAIYKKYGADALDPNRVVDLLVQRSFIKQAVQYLLEVLGDRDAPEDAALQTRVLEVALQFAPPQVPDKIFEGERHSHYDKQKIAGMCEKAGLWARALEIYAKLRAETGQEQYLVAIHRCFTHPEGLSPDFVENYFSRLSKDDSLAVLRELLAANMQANFKMVVKVACAYADKIGAAPLVDLFLQYNSWEAIFYFLQRVVPTSQDPDVHYRYIEAAAKLQNFAEVERMTRESDFYDAERVKALLKELRLQDLWPFVNVCDKHNLIDEMVRYLFENRSERYIEQYVQKRAPTRLPDVAGALIDVDAPEDMIRGLVMSVGGLCPVGPLVEAFESRNRLRLLRPWLEAQKEEGNTDVELYNAIAKILVDTNDGAERFLQTDDHYDKRVLGKYCERRDPYLSIICYSRGDCDDEIVRITAKNCMFKDLAKYLVRRKNQALWVRALRELDESEKGPLVDQVVNNVLPESSDTEEVITAVRAFMEVDMPNQLIDLLEKIVLGPSEFRGNVTLSNVLLQTAFQANSDRVGDLINRIDKFDPAQVEASARQHGRYEELVTMFQKTGKNHAQAVKVLVEDLRDLARAVQYAERLPDGEPTTKEVWGVIGRAQLAAGSVVDSISAFVRAADVDSFDAVVDAALANKEYTELVRYLQMCRADRSSRVKASVVDARIVFCLAKTNRLGDLEEFLTAPNSLNSETLVRTGDDLMGDESYEAARVLFQAVGNWGRLATCLVKLKNYDAAADAAQKANSVKVWRDVCFACVDADPPEFRLAQQCAWHVVIVVDELEAVINHYEQRGLYEELIGVLQHGTTHERAPNSLFTELGILLARHKSDKVVDFVKRHAKKLTPHKLIRVCEMQHLWTAVRTLHTLTGDYDHALRTVLEHPGAAWDHEVTKDLLTRATSPDLAYKVIHMYLDIAPEFLGEVFDAARARLDPARVVTELDSRGVLVLGKEFLESVAAANLPVVNNALHNLYIAADDVAALGTVIDQYGNFDQVALAQRLEKHEIVEFRRVAAKLYRKNNKWRGAIELAKRDKLYRDAAESAAESGDADLVEDLLRWFLDNGLQDSFAAALCTCYDLVRPDVAIELAWKHDVVGCGMPFVVQLVKDQHDRLKALEAKVEALAAGHGGAGGANAPPVLAITGGPGGPMGGAPAPGRPW